ncbi:MAG: iron ABC transporter substrate-binding protein [Phycisphaerae bacterium]|nr:iron ABC transporter substrate-binding protein [Phycisphaerae bacterium]
MSHRFIKSLCFLSAMLSIAMIPQVVMALQSSEQKQEPVEIVVYSGRKESLIGPAIAKYMEATGNKVKVKYGSTSGMTALLLEEGDATPASVFIAQDAGALGALAKKDRLHKLPKKITGKVDSRFRSPKDEWVGISGRARAVVYNVNKTSPSEMPVSIRDFTDPKWKGRIGWAPGNGSFQAFVTGMRERDGDEATEAWLRGIMANEPVVYPKNTAIVRAVGAGEVDLGFVNHYYLYRFLNEDSDFPARNHFMPGGDPGSLVNVAGACIPNPDLDEARKAKALEFIEFLLAKDAQSYFANKTYEYPLIKGVDPSVEMIELEKIQTPDMDLSNLDDLQGTLVMLRKVDALP